MNFEITNLTNEEIDNSLLEKVINKVSEKLNITNSTLSIVLVNNPYIHKINKEYRDIDKETDVISFAFMDNEYNPLTEQTDLGEIYISIDKAHSQSIEYNHSFERELCFLLCHGILHLLGYDHMKKEDEKIMFSLQEEILSSIGVNR